MKSDFTLAKEELSRIGIKRVAADFYAEPKRKGSVYFVKSPATHDKTASLALYPNSNRFTDFANGNLSGDCIAFVAYIKNINQWQALKELQAYYGLTDAREQEKEEARRRIQLQQEQERKRAERQQEFLFSLSGYIDELKERERLYRLAIEKGICTPLSALWCDCKSELQRIDYELNILCATDCDTYRRMKDYAADELPTDFYQWLIDVLELLKWKGLFIATTEELSQIKKKRVLELKKAGRGWKVGC